MIFPLSKARSQTSKSNDGPLALTGDAASQGRKNTAGVLLGAAAWGPLALLNKGNNGKLKAGEIVTGYAVPAAR